MSDNATRSISGAVALVTGASRGIGRAIVCDLAREGAIPVLTGRDRDALTETARLAGLSDPQIILADMEEPEAPERVLDAVKSRHAKIDILVSNAGMPLDATLEQTTIEEWDRILAVNARAPFFIFQRALPLLRTADHPVVIAISSVVGRKGYRGQAAYSASKHALEGFTKAFAREVQDEGIRVHLLAPGGVATDMVRIMRPDIDESELIAPEEIARIVTFLATSAGGGMIDSVSVRRNASTPWG